MQQTEKCKIFKAAPLPFIGQKRFFIKQFIEVLNENLPGDGSGWTIVDAFGGSGLLSHTAKSIKPAACVIYNDFDGYAERLRHIDDTNRLLRIVREIVGNSERQGKNNCLKAFRHKLSKLYKILTAILI